MKDEPPVSEAKLREDYVLLENYRAQLEGMTKQQQLLQLAVEEHVRARETIKSLSKGAAGDEILVPIGADSYIHAKISDSREAIVGVGSSVSIKRTPEEAEKILDTRIDELSRAFKSLADRSAQMEAEMQELSERVQSQIEQIESHGKA